MGTLQDMLILYAICILPLCHNGITGSISAPVLPGTSNLRSFGPPYEPGADQSLA
jgi:hypothetical protein